MLCGHTFENVMKIMKIYVFIFLIINYLQTYHITFRYNNFSVEIIFNKNSVVLCARGNMHKILKKIVYVREKHAHAL